MWDQTLAIAHVSHSEGEQNLPKQTLVQTHQDQLLRRELKYKEIVAGDKIQKQYDAVCRALPEIL